MNCQDIGRLLDSGRFGALSASEHRDAEAHAHACSHCAPRWGVHSRMANMPIAPMPHDFALQIQSLVAARARGNVLRFVPRRTMIVAGAFVVLAAAAAMVTVRYVAPALQRAAAPVAPRLEPAVVVAPVAEPVIAPAPVAPPPAPVVFPAVRPAPPPPVVEAARPAAGGLIQQPGKSVQQVVQGEQDVNRTTTFTVAVATIGAAVAAEPPAATEPPRTGPAEIVASNDLNKDGIVTRDEAKQVNGNLSVMWEIYDMDHDGMVDVAEVTRASGEIATGTALQKINDSSGGRLASARPEAIMGTNDLNQDGIVTREEAKQHNGSLNRMWDSYDLNKDGKVDAAEIAKASGY